LPRPSVATFPPAPTFSVLFLTFLLAFSLFCDRMVPTPSSLFPSDLFLGFFFPLSGVHTLRRLLRIAVSLYEYGCTDLAKVAVLIFPFSPPLLSLFSYGLSLLTTEFCSLSLDVRRGSVPLGWASLDSRAASLSGLPFSRLFFLRPLLLFLPAAGGRLV